MFMSVMLRYFLFSLIFLIPSLSIAEGNRINWDVTAVSVVYSKSKGSCRENDSGKLHKLYFEQGRFLKNKKLVNSNYTSLIFIVNIKSLGISEEEISSIRQSVISQLSMKDDLNQSIISVDSVSGLSELIRGNNLVFNVRSGKGSFSCPITNSQLLNWAVGFSRPECNYSADSLIAVYQAETDRVFTPITSDNTFERLTCYNSKGEKIKQLPRLVENDRVLIKNSSNTILASAKVKAVVR